MSRIDRGAAPRRRGGNGAPARAITVSAAERALQASTRVEELRVRRAVIDAAAGLGERELGNLAALADAAARAFRARGIDALTATLAAELAVTAFRVAVTR